MDQSVILTFTQPAREGDTVGFAHKEETCAEARNLLQLDSNRMVQVVGALLVTSLLVTPAATAQLIGKSFRSCMIWTQIFGISSVLIGLYLSSELETGSGSMIALVTAIVFCLVALIKAIFADQIDSFTNPELSKE